MLLPAFSICAVKMVVFGIGGDQPAPVLGVQ